MKNTQLHRLLNGGIQMCKKFGDGAPYPNGTYRCRSYWAKRTTAITKTGVTDQSQIDRILGREIHAARQQATAAHLAATTTAPQHNPVENDDEWDRMSQASLDVTEEYNEAVRREVRLMLSWLRRHGAPEHVRDLAALGLAPVDVIGIEAKEDLAKRGGGAVSRRHVQAAAAWLDEVVRGPLGLPPLGDVPKAPDACGPLKGVLIGPAGRPSLPSDEYVLGLDHLDSETWATMASGPLRHHRWDATGLALRWDDSGPADAARAGARRAYARRLATWFGAFFGTLFGPAAPWRHEAA